MNSSYFVYVHRSGSFSSNCWAGSAQPTKADLTARVKKSNETRHVFRILANYLAAAFYQQEMPTEDPSLRPEDQSDEPPEEEAGETNQSEFDTIQRLVSKQVLKILAAGE